MAIFFIAKRNGTALNTITKCKGKREKKIQTNNNDTSTSKKNIIIQKLVLIVIEFKRCYIKGNISDKDINSRQSLEKCVFVNKKNYNARQKN